MGTRWFALTLLVGAGTLSMSGCSGRIIGSEPAVRSNSGQPTPPAMLETPEAVLPPPCLPGEAGPADLPIRRLSNWEYDNTVRDLLGTTTQASAAFGLVPDGSVSGFDNNSEIVSISGPVFERFERAATELAKAATGTPEALRALLGCDATDPTCLARFTEGFTRRAFRRSIDAEELSALDLLMSSGQTVGERASLLVEAVLLSPSFLFRPEIGTPHPDDAALVRLTGAEVATRLSYLILGSTPSAELLQLAESGGLDTSQGLDQQARALLGDPRAHDGLAHFYRQWLRADLPTTVRRDANVFPDWSLELATSMSQELARLAEHFVWEPSADLLGMIDAPFSFIDNRLAALYGVAPPAQDWARVDFPPEARRGGLLTSAAFLTVTSKVDRPAPILRGKFVREVLMCFEVPPPPPDAPELAAPISGESERARLERHAQSPACAGCHQMTDPIGFGLAGYDAIGKRREVDELGGSIDERGRINGDNATDFEGALDLERQLRERPEVGECVVQQFVRYGLGGAGQASRATECTQQELLESFGGAKHNFPELVVALAKSQAFTTRVRHDPSEGM